MDSSAQHILRGRREYACPCRCTGMKSVSPSTLFTSLTLNHTICARTRQKASSASGAKICQGGPGDDQELLEFR